MAKFINFHQVNINAGQPFGPDYDVLINVDDIAKIAATGATGQNAKTLIVSFKQSALSTPDSTNPKTVSFAVHADNVATTNPTLTTGSANTIYDAVIRALTANPGGVKSTVSLPRDQAATPLQMYFSGATWA
tara:strand:- start:23151 stop:23546 length:396 start_codon:yes stop_codon:yes gene_type:complete